MHPMPSGDPRSQEDESGRSNPISSGSDRASSSPRGQIGEPPPHVPAVARSHGQEGVQLENSKFKAIVFYVIIAEARRGRRAGLGSAPKSDDEPLTTDTRCQISTGLRRKLDTGCRRLQYTNKDGTNQERRWLGTPAHSLREWADNSSAKRSA